MKECSTEGEVMKQQQRMKVMKVTIRKIRSQGRVDAVGGSVKYWLSTARRLGSTQERETPCMTGWVR